MLENVEVVDGLELKERTVEAARIVIQDGGRAGVQSRQIEAKIRNIRIMFLLGTAYASNIGGTGVITGSSTNVVALDLIRKDA